MAVFDCLIIGGGPAGLSAAIYASRLLLSVTVIDAGGGRASLIPCTRNQAGFPEGISGVELLNRARSQAQQFGAQILEAKVRRLTRSEDTFEAEGEFDTVRASSVILATGVTDRRPVMSAALHDAALASGRLRYCPICDGFEVKDQKVAVVGTSARGAREATFIRSFTEQVTLIAPDGVHWLDVKDRQELADRGVKVIDGPVRNFALCESGIVFDHAEGRERFDTFYPALGSDIHSELARSLGAELTQQGCIRVDAHQRTTVSGLYAAGDVVIGLDQISHAVGEAGVAATTLRNDLHERSARLR